MLLVHVQHGSVGVASAVLAIDIAGVVQHLAGQLYIVVRELANLSIVDAEDFSLLGSAERETWDQVHDKEDDAGTAEGVDTASYGISELVAELDPVAIEPAAGDDAEAVEMCYVVCGEESGQDVANETADGVLGEDIEGIINAEDELELGGVLEDVSLCEIGEKEGHTLAPAAPTTP